MNRLDNLFVRNEREAQRLQQVAVLADQFAKQANVIDQEGRFAHEHIEALRTISYFSATVPSSAGGEGISIYEMVMRQERLAQGDASIALAVGWHLSVMYEINLTKRWKDEDIAALNEQVVKHQRLVNRAASEKASGSPTRGGKPQTTANLVPIGGGSYVINGRKTFTSLSPALDYFLVTATLGDEVVEFSIDKAAEGVSIDPTWHMVGMRGTASHDLVLDQVVVPATALKQVMPKQKGNQPSPHLLHIPACYLGIAMAARKEAIKFAATYQPNSLSKPIIELPHIIAQLGQMELQLQTARHFLYSVADRWDKGIIAPELLQAEMQAVKVQAVNTAISVVDLAMRIVGAHSLAINHPLQRMYRDVRFGLHNPPMEDAVITMLGKLAIADSNQEQAQE